ncbi:homoserine dehydrogenase [Sedimentibacter acidaminivorans]|uniref:Homoserine dehydrogenase n=1 Tax=Sedimentibacter acidaminivorans TaxID=913099 RepID=A0ABS4G9I7_9FIRM|nr:homoserine dehydrogenase [Sedimentibacter acidaminivorans]MBP1924352.1 homoserine dehydrogenase [Sedimentibacter acidaminivorans]
MTKILKIAMLGFGNAGQAFAKILLNKHDEIINKYDCNIQVVAIATKSKGSLINENGINLKDACLDIEKKHHFNEEKEDYSKLNSIEIARVVEYDVLIELTPLQIFTGQPAIDHITTALNRKKHVITANKGPIAWTYETLKELAKKQGVLFYYETTVMDGTPIFNLVDETLQFCKVTEINGILNTTTNFVLEELANGKPYDSIIKEGKERGFVEADPSMDIEGWDAAAKTAALLNVLMQANITPSDINRKGIEDITYEQIKEAKSRGNVIKLLCHGSIKNGQVVGTVEPKEIKRDTLLSSITGTSSVVTITTDLMGTISIVEHDPEIEQTGYGVFSDLVRILKNS